MKKDMRGLHGNQGRKPTGRKRDINFATKLTFEEKVDIVTTAEEEGKTQADYIVDIHREHKIKKDGKQCKQ